MWHPVACVVQRSVVGRYVVGAVCVGNAKSRVVVCGGRKGRSGNGKRAVW